MVNQAAKKNANAAAAAVAAARAGTPSSTAAGDDNSTNTNNNNNINNSNNAGTPTGTPAATPAPSAVPPPPPPPPTPAPAVVPFHMEPLVAATDIPWEVAGTIGKVQFSSLVSLDVVVAQCISNCESEERSKKLYGSIILVGGGGMIKGFDHVLEDRYVVLILLPHDKQQKRSHGNTIAWTHVCTILKVLSNSCFALNIKHPLDSSKPYLQR